jgi:hypothetical protein
VSLIRAFAGAGILSSWLYEVTAIAGIASSPYAPLQLEVFYPLTSGRGPV